MNMMRFESEMKNDKDDEEEKPMDINRLPAQNVV